MEEEIQVRKTDLYFVYVYGGEDEPELMFVSDEPREVMRKATALRKEDPLSAKQFSCLKGTVCWGGENDKLDSSDSVFVTMKTACGTYEPEIEEIGLISEGSVDTLEEWHYDICDLFYERPVDEKDIEEYEPIDEETERQAMDDYFAQQELIFASFEVPVYQIGKNAAFQSIITPKANL